MTDTEIIEKAIHRAVDNGWKKPELPFEVDLSGEIYVCPKIRLWDEWVDLEHVIFDIEFARALWGEKFHGSPGEYYGESYRPLTWQYHLQQMAIAPDRIKYLGENI